MVRYFSFKYIQQFISKFCIVSSYNVNNKINVSTFILFLKIYIIFQPNNFLKWITRAEDVHNYDLLLEVEIIKLLNSLTNKTIVISKKKNKKYFCYIKWKFIYFY